MDAVERVFTGVGLPFPLMDSRLGASLPSFAVAFVLSLVVLPRRSAGGSRSDEDERSSVVVPVILVAVALVLVLVVPVATLVDLDGR